MLEIGEDLPYFEQGKYDRETEARLAYLVQVVARAEEMALVRVSAASVNVTRVKRLGPSPRARSVGTGQALRSQWRSRSRAARLRGGCIVPPMGMAHATDRSSRSSLDLTGGQNE
jgi:hypothetical protein